MTSRALLALALLAACGRGDTPAPADDNRPAIAVKYVRGGDLMIRARPTDVSAVIATYSRGTSVSVLSHHGEWEEVRVADRSGWARAIYLADAAEAKQAEVDNLNPRFKVRPPPVTSPNAHGEIVLEARVNQDGEVIDVRTIENTIGSAELALGNSQALRASRFEPIVQRGERKPFTYEYRVHY
jgi:hypothetical protein